MAKKTGLKNENLVQRILQKGSTALKSRNSIGVNVFSGSVDDDGIVSGKLTKSKYNENELLKSIDTNIFELLPPEVPPEPDVVPRPIYEEALLRISELETDVENLNLQISDLQSLVNELRIVSQSLRIELDGKDLVVASVENQNQQNLQQTQTTILDLQNSIQRATSEVIQRTSLEAVNQTLQEEVTRLTERLEGKDAKLQEGYEVGQRFAWALGRQNETLVDGIVFNARAKDKGDGTFKNGPQIKLNNFTEEPVTVTFSITGAVKDAFRAPGRTTIPPKSEVSVSISTVKDRVKKLTPKNAIGTIGDTLYQGKLTITDQLGDSKDVELEIEKMRGDKFNRANAIVKS